MLLLIMAVIVGIPSFISALIGILGTIVGLIIVAIKSSNKH